MLYCIVYLQGAVLSVVAGLGLGYTARDGTVTDL